MKSSLLAMLLAASVTGSAWCQSVPKNAAELARYMAADRERLLYEGAKKEGKLVWRDLSAATEQQAAELLVALDELSKAPAPAAS